MPVIIVDASALAALIFGEPQAEEMARQMVGARLVSPSLIWFELANVCVKKAKTHPDQREKIVSADTRAARLVAHHFWRRSPPAA